MTTTIRIDAKRYEDCDDCLAAAAADVARDRDLSGWDLSPRWEDDATREVILVDVPAGDPAHRGRADRVTIYLPDHVRAALGPCGEDSGVSLSGRLATIVLRYQETIRRARPRLTRAEWMLILDALNGVGLLAEGPDAAIAGLALEVHDHCRLNDAARKWGITAGQAGGLVARLRALPYVEALSVVEAAEQFWSRAQQPTDQAMAEAGIVPSDAPPAKPR